MSDRYFSMRGKRRKLFNNLIAMITLLRSVSLHLSPIKAYQHTLPSHKAFDYWAVFGFNNSHVVSIDNRDLRYTYVSFYF